MRTGYRRSRRGKRARVARKPSRRFTKPRGGLRKRLTRRGRVPPLTRTIQSADRVSQPLLRSRRGRFPRVSRRLKRFARRLLASTAEIRTLIFKEPNTLLFQQLGATGVEPTTVIVYPWDMARYAPFSANAVETVQGPTAHQPQSNQGPMHVMVGHKATFHRIKIGFSIYNDANFPVLVNWMWFIPKFAVSTVGSSTLQKYVDFSQMSVPWIKKLQIGSDIPAARTGGSYDMQYPFNTAAYKIKRRGSFILAGLSATGQGQPDPATDCSYGRQHNRYFTFEQNYPSGLTVDYSDSYNFFSSAGNSPGLWRPNAQWLPYFCVFVTNLQMGTETQPQVAFQYTISKTWVDV